MGWIRRLFGYPEPEPEPKRHDLYIASIWGGGPELRCTCGMELALHGGTPQDLSNTVYEHDQRAGTVRPGGYADYIIDPKDREFYEKYGFEP